MAKQKIKVPHGCTEVLTVLYRTTEEIVKNALNFETNSKLAKIIRTTALRDSIGGNISKT